jgi:hypothetical protein
MGATAAANAAVVYSGILNFSCAVDLDGTYINVEAGVLSNGPGTGVTGWDVNPYSTSGGMNFYNSTGGGQMHRPGVTTGTAGNLALGTVIGAAGSFNVSTGNVFGTTSATGLNGGWTYSSENIIGFRFRGCVWRHPLRLDALLDGRDRQRGSWQQRADSHGG